LGELAVQAEDVNGACVIHVIGDAGIKNAERLDMELCRRCTLHPLLAVIDLSGLTFISSLGLGALVSFQRTMKRHGGTVRLAALSERFNDAFRKAQLHQIFEMHDTVEDALSR
jgi:anti-sigma B factor antagonist